MLVSGASQKCIQDSEGKWYTPTEFEASGDRARWKSWRKSIDCKEFPLEKLMKVCRLANNACNINPYSVVLKPFWGPRGYCPIYKCQGVWLKWCLGNSASPHCGKLLNLWCTYPNLPCLFHKPTQNGSQIIDGPEPTIWEPLPWLISKEISNKTTNLF